MRLRFVFITLLLSVFLLSFSGGCKEERKRDRDKEGSHAREVQSNEKVHPIVKQFEDWSIHICACPGNLCVMRYVEKMDDNNNAFARSDVSEDGDLDRITAATDRGTRCAERILADEERQSKKLEMTDEHCRGEALRNCQHRHPDWGRNPTIGAQYSACLAEIYTTCRLKRRFPKAKGR